MSKGIIETVGGVALLAGGAVLASMLDPAVAAEWLVSMSHVLISAGAGMTLSGVGTLMSKGAMSGYATTLRDPAAPWKIDYGCLRAGDNIIGVPQRKGIP